MVLLQLLEFYRGCCRGWWTVRRAGGRGGEAGGSTRCSLPEPADGAASGPVASGPAGWRAGLAGMPGAQRDGRGAVRRAEGAAGGPATGGAAAQPAAGGRGGSGGRTGRRAVRWRGGQGGGRSGGGRSGGGPAGGAAGRRRGGRGGGGRTGRQVGRTGNDNIF